MVTFARNGLCYIVVPVLLCFVVGCSGPKSTGETPQPDGAESPKLLYPGGAVPAAKTPEALMQEWTELADDPSKTIDEKLSNTRFAMIGIELSMPGPDGVKPLLDVLADPKVSLEKKVLVLTSLSNAVDASLVPRLKELTAESQDAGTRECATELLAQTRLPDVQPVLKALAKDPNPRIHIAALKGLMAQGDAAARTELWGIAQKQDTRKERRQTILTELSAAPKPEDAPPLVTCALDDTLPHGIRTQLLAALAQVGDAQSAASLEKLAGPDGPENLRPFAQSAIDAIEQRLKGAGA